MSEGRLRDRLLTLLGLLAYRLLSLVPPATSWPGSRVVSTDELRMLCPEALEFMPFDPARGRLLLSVERVWWEARDSEEVWHWDVDQAYWMPSERIWTPWGGAPWPSSDAFWM